MHDNNEREHELICIKYFSTYEGKQKSNKIYHSEGIFLFFCDLGDWNGVIFSTVIMVLLRRD